MKYICTVKSCAYGMTGVCIRNPCPYDRCYRKPEALGYEKIVEYKGYRAKVKYSVTDRTFYGKVQSIEDSIIFELKDPSEAEAVLQKVIEDYLNMCADIVKDPSQGGEEQEQ